MSADSLRFGLQEAFHEAAARLNTDQLEWIAGKLQSMSAAAASSEPSVWASFTYDDTVYTRAASTHTLPVIGRTLRDEYGCGSRGLQVAGGWYVHPPHGTRNSRGSFYPCTGIGGTFTGGSTFACALMACWVASTSQPQPQPQPSSLFRFQRSLRWLLLNLCWRETVPSLARRQVCFDGRCCSFYCYLNGV